MLEEDQGGSKGKAKSPKPTGSEAIMKEAIEQACIDRDRSRQELKESLAERERLREELGTAQNQHDEQREALENKLASVKFEAAQARAENEDLKWDLNEALGGGSGLQGERPRMPLPQMQPPPEPGPGGTHTEAGGSGWFR